MKKFFLIAFAIFMALELSVLSFIIWGVSEADRLSHYKVCEALEGVSVETHYVEVVVRSSCRRFGNNEVAYLHSGDTVTLTGLLYNAPDFKGASQYDNWLQISFNGKNQWINYDALRYSVELDDFHEVNVNIRPIVIILCVIWALSTVAVVVIVKKTSK